MRALDEKLSRSLPGNGAIGLNADDGTARKWRVMQFDEGGDPVNHAKSPSSPVSYPFRVNTLHLEGSGYPPPKVQFITPTEKTRT